MYENELFTLEEVSRLCNINVEFIREIAQFGIIEFKKMEMNDCIRFEEIGILKMIKRLYYDLGVNKEGIDIILSMREQIQSLRNEVNELKIMITDIRREQHFRNISIVADKGMLIDI